MGFKLLLLLLLLCVSLSFRQPSYTTQCAMDDFPFFVCFLGCFEKCRSSSSQQAKRLKFAFLHLFLFTLSLSFDLYREARGAGRRKSLKLVEQDLGPGRFLL
uniref:Putative secreted peptide n=1 Tax=Anopheles braziliensis TaxID=58242 RepID=A0A2M3ZN91_9DIPT